MKTYSARTQDNPRKWCIIDAKDLILGRLASEIAFRLRGKNIPEFTPHSDMGESIIVVNAEKIRVTGKKLVQKMYYRHSMYPGGLKTTSLKHLMAKKPTEALRQAVFGMLPKNPMGREVMRKLKIYAGETHPHTAQLPEQFTLKIKL